MKLLKILLISILVTNITHAGISDYFEKANIEKKLKQEIADLDVSLKLKLGDLTLLDGINLSSRYKYEVEPSYKSNFYSRVDKWNLKTGINVGDMVDDLPFYFNMSKGSEVIFVRQFKSQKKALTAKPYLINRIPHNAKRAINKLAPGDFVAIPAEMNIVVGSTISMGSDNLSTNVQYVLSGKFMFHIFRMKDNRVRVKLIVQKSRSTQGGSKAELDVDVVGLKVVNDRIEKFLELDLFNLSLNKENGNIFIVDYVFDLNHEDAKKAYNDLLGTTYKFKDVEIVTTGNNPYKLEDKFFSTFEASEKLAIEDRALPKGAKRVARVFKGYNKYKTKSNKLKLGLIIASYGVGKKYTENSVSHEKISGQKEYFFYPNYTIESTQKLGIWPFRSKEKTYRSVFGLVPTDKDGNGRDYTDYGFIIDSRDNLFRHSERTKVQQIVRDTLPEQFYEEIDWKEWRELNKVINGRFYYQVILKNSAFGAIPYMTQKQLKKKLKAYYKKRKKLSKGPIYSVISGSWKLIKLDFITRRFKIKSLSEKLHSVLYENLDGKQKIKKLMSLRRNDYFQKIGMGFIMSLIPENQQDKHLYIELNIQTGEKENISYKLGTQNYSTVYKELQHIMNAIHKRSYDLRINEEEVRYNEINGNSLN